MKDTDSGSLFERAAAVRPLHWATRTAKSFDGRAVGWLRGQ
ncbi:MAG TPA: hypothetical protein VM076_19610 [Gemmatimonadaceae bacterium]|nr:hypothetical protein [Gemmatimonadaceae bacterium]